MRADVHVSDPEALESMIDRVFRGEADHAERVELERHLADCADCAAEVDAAMALQADMAADKMDEALNRAVVERVMSQLPGPQGRVAVGRERRFQRWFVAVFAGAATVATVVFAVGRHHPVPPSTAVESSPQPLALPPVVLNDGSQILPADSSTTIQVRQEAAERTTVYLRSGSARFRVRHDNRRVFSVDVGTIVIEDLGTIFRVDRETDGQVRVAVSEGRVAVHYAGEQGRIELGAGDERAFPAVGEPRNPTAQTNDVPKPPSTRTPPRARTVDEVAGLLTSADVARRSGNPEAAVAPLRRLVDRFPSDPRTASAAFTLGWVLLTELGRPREAAAAFVQAERAAPRGALAEDAAARLAEAWQKAGDLQHAAQAARHYQDAYPKGRYTSLMRGLVGGN